MALSVLTPKQAELPGKPGWIIIAYRSTFEENSEELESLKKKKESGERNKDSGWEKMNWEE